MRYKDKQIQSYEAPSATVEEVRFEGSMLLTNETNSAVRGGYGEVEEI